MWSRSKLWWQLAVAGVAGVVVVVIAVLVVVVVVVVAMVVVGAGIVVVSDCCQNRGPRKEGRGKRYI